MGRIYDWLNDQVRNPKIFGSRLNDEFDFKGGITINNDTSNALTPPTQTTPITSTIAVGSTYADSGSGNIFQISSWVDNSGTRSTVAVFGQGRATGANGKAWGGNFVAYAGAAGALAQGVEVDYGVAASISSQSAFGIAVNLGGGALTGNDTAGLIFDRLSTTPQIKDGIRFNAFLGGNPYNNSLLTCAAVTPTFGIDFSAATFGSGAFKSTGFLVDGAGGVHAAAVESGLVVGGTAAASALVLQSTTNGSPSGDVVAYRGNTQLFQNPGGGTTFGEFHPSGGFTVGSGVSDPGGSGIATVNVLATNVQATGLVSAGGAVSASTWFNVAAGTTGLSSLRINSGTAPTSPVNGDIWFDGTNLKMRVGGVTKTFTLT